MNIDLIVELGWKSALVAAATLLLLHLLRSRSAAEQSVVAQTGLVAILLLPLAALALPALELAAPAVETAVILPAATSLAGPIITPTAVAAAPAAAPIAASAQAWNWELLALLAYALPALLLLSLLAAALARLAVIRARATELSDRRWRGAFERASRRAGIKRADLRVSDRLGSPASWGLFRPVIVIDPATAADASGADAILAHELAHIARRDWLRLLAGRIAVAFYWFNPFVWMLAHRSHRLCEEAADDAVLLGNVRGTDYAALLVDAVRGARHSRLAANAIAPSRSAISRRVRHVLDASRPRGGARRLWVASTLLLGLGAAAAIAATEQGRPAPAAGSSRAPAPVVLPAAAQASVQPDPIVVRDGENRRWEDLTEAEQEEVRETLRRVEPEIRAAAERAREATRHAIDAEAIARQVREREPEIRAAIAEAQLALRAAGQSEIVMRQLAEQEPEIRRQVEEALAMLDEGVIERAIEQAAAAAELHSEAEIDASVERALEELRRTEEMLENISERNER